MRTFCEQEGIVIQMRTSALLVTKTSDFSKFLVCPHGQGGSSPANIFADKGGSGG